MSRFVDKKATDEIILENGDKVQVRQRLTAAESAELDRYLARIKVDTTTGKMVSEEGDWHYSRIAICKAYIVDWNFKEDDGQPVAYSPNLVDGLDDDTVNEIVKAIDQIEKQRKEEGAKKGKNS